MLVARVGFGSLPLVLLALVACAESRASRADAGSSAPLDISGIDCARTSLGQNWKLPVLPTLLGCRTHADCTKQPHGSCVGYPQFRCDYASGPGHFHELCSTDADCVNDVGGFCTEALEATQCVYDECSVDADCGLGRACLCYDGGGDHYCVSDGCHADADCEAGQHCRLDESLGGVYPQWHCSTASDACDEKAECGPGDSYCGYDLELQHWLCRPFTSVF